jgi:hypothetical protein
LYRGVNDFRKDYQRRTNNVVKDEKGDLVADCHSILARRRNHFSQLLNVHGINDDGQTDVHAAEPLVPEPTASEVEMAIDKLKRHKSPGIDQILAGLVEAGGMTIQSEIHKLTISIWNKEELPEQWKVSIIVPVCEKGNKTDRSNYQGISLLSTMYKILSIILLSRVTPYAQEITGDHECGFYITGQPLIIHSVFINT